MGYSSGIIILLTKSACQISIHQQSELADYGFTEQRDWQSVHRLECSGSRRGAGQPSGGLLFPARSAGQFAEWIVGGLCNENIPAVPG